jgi:DNA-binding LacI/PurR family transcriptional regulator
VNEPKYRLGSAAVLLMQQLLKGQRSETRPLPAELVIRSSTGICPAASRL